MSEQKMEKLFSDLKGFMNEKFNQINDRLDEHDKNFESIERRFDEHDKHFESIERRFDEHDKHFESLERRFDEHNKQQQIDLKNLEARIMKRFDEHEEKQRLDFARIEHVMYDRTAALFDAREVSLDEDENLYSKLKSLERVLDKHHYRITELESKSS